MTENDSERWLFDGLLRDNDSEFFDGVFAGMARSCVKSSRMMQ